MKPPISSSTLSAFFSRIVEALPDRPTPAAPAFDAYAQRWQQIGLRPGDLVLLSLPNGIELLDHFFGVLMAGGVPALVAPNTPVSRLRQMASLMHARAIGALRLPLDDSLGTHEHAVLGNLHVGLFPKPPSPAATAGEVVMLTSGTSGFASGCVFDFEALLLNGRRHADSIGQRGDDVLLISLPLHFSFGLVAMALATLQCGNRVVIGGPPFHVPTFEQTLRQHNVTISSLTPVLVRSVMQASPQCLAGLRVMSVGGDMLAAPQVERLLECRGGRELYLTYGLTQAGPRVSTLAAHAEPSHRYNSVGLPLAGTVVSLREIRDDTSRRQLHVSSATVMKRQIGLVEGRKHDQQPAAQTVATGDVFEQDGDGYLYYISRLSDYITRRGEKISLTAVRRIAIQIPRVVSARTPVVNLGELGQDFDLELYTDADAEGDTEHAARFLRHWLKLAEMPRNIRILSGEKLVAGSYK